jgi:hypothetical protein
VNLNQIRIDLNFYSKSPKEIGKTHCFCELTAAHGHNCPGRPGPAWPAHDRGLWPAHCARARQCAVTTPEYVQHAWCGAELDGGLNPKPVMENGLGNTVVAPLHQKLEGDDGKGILIGAELSSVATLSVEADKWLEEEEVPRAWFSSCTRMARV